MDLTLLEELSEVLTKFLGTKCNIIQLENIFRFVFKLEVEKGSSFVQNLKDKIFSVIKEQGSNVSHEQVNALASTLFMHDLDRKCEFLELFSNDLNWKRFSAVEFEEIDIDLDTSISHYAETFHLQDCHAIEDSRAPLYGTDKCPCVCHTEQHSVNHCFTCAMQFVQGCTYTTTHKEKVHQGTKTSTDTPSGS